MAKAERWAVAFTRCRGCRTVHIKHHANGLCRSCYSAGRTATVGSWPAWLRVCLACRGRDGLAYRAAGLCRRCHRRALRAGVLSFWRMICTVKRAMDGDGDRDVLVSIIRTVGVTATACMIDQGKQMTIEQATGDRQIDADTASAIMDAFLRVQDE